MALAATLKKKYKTAQFTYMTFQIVASGSYATGGDSLDFSTVTPYTNRQPIAPPVIVGIAGFVYQYDLTNKKMLVYCNTAGGANAPLGEHTAAGYAAGVTGDTIIATVIIGG